MPLSAQQKRERRAAQRGVEAQDAARGQRKPRNRAPTGCYWDPQPGEATGTWRKFLTDEAVDVAEAKRARDAALRRKETTRAARARLSALGSMGAGCSTDHRASFARLQEAAEELASAAAAADAVDEADGAAAGDAAATEDAPAELYFDVAGHGRLMAATSDDAGFVGCLAHLPRELLGVARGSTRCRIEARVDGTAANGADAYVVRLIVSNNIKAELAGAPDFW